MWSFRDGWSPAAVPQPPQISEGSSELISAVRRAREAVLSDPGSAETWGRLGHVFLGNNLYRQAAESYGQAMTLAPEDGRWHYLQAVAVEYIDLPGSVALYERAMRLSPDAPYRWLRYGLALERAGQLDRARQSWEKVLELVPADVDAHLGLGRLALGRQDLDAAQHHFLAAAEQDPANRQAHIALIQICSRKGDDEGLQKHRELLKSSRSATVAARDPLRDEVSRERISPEYVRLLARGDQLESRGDLPGFVAVCRRLIALDPDNPLPRVRQGIALARMGNLRQSLDVFVEAIRWCPEDPGVHFNYGVVLGQAGRWNDAISAFQKSVHLKPDDAEACYSLGICLYQVSRTEEAVAAFQRSVAARPDHYFAHYNLGEAFRRLGRPADALEHFQFAVQLRPDEPRARSALENLLREMK